MNERVKKIREQFAACGIDGLLVSAPQDVRYACGIAGSGDPREIELLVTARDVCLIADGRNTTMARTACPDARIVDCTDMGRDAAIAQTVRDLEIAVLGIDENACSIADERSLAKNMGAIAQCKPAPSFILQKLRSQKSSDELLLLKKACGIAQQTASWIAQTIRSGYREREYAWMLEQMLRHLGAEKIAFETIVASGENSANPHHHTGNRTLQDGDAVVCDFGAVVEGYHSDMTRTFFLGTPTDEQQRVCAIVQKAQRKAVEELRAGKTGAEIDAIARALIAQEGFGEYFTHGLGHGIGLQVHEYPVLSKRYGEPLAAGAVVTIEPGIYLPGKFGVRIEDDFLVKEDGCACLTEG